MTVAVIGTGKTGQHVVRLAEEAGDRVLAFDESRKPTASALSEADVAVIFVPGDAAAELVDPLLEAGIPAAWGTTGFDWPEDLPERVRRAGTRWIIAPNFSLGMNLVRRCLEIMGRGAARLLDRPEYHIHEVHHIHKKDAPSGTALKWQEWLGLGEEVSISSSREGDVNGVHSVHVKTPFESIWLKHEAHDRAIFAEGALWAARYLVRERSVRPGLYRFETIIDEVFDEE